MNLLSSPNCQALKHLSCRLLSSCQKTSPSLQSEIIKQFRKSNCLSFMGNLRKIQFWNPHYLEKRASFSLVNDISHHYTWWYCRLKNSKDPQSWSHLQLADSSHDSSSELKFPEEQQAFGSSHEKSNERGWRCLKKGIPEATAFGGRSGTASKRRGILGAWGSHWEHQEAEREVSQMAWA